MTSQFLSTGNCCLCSTKASANQLLLSIMFGPADAGRDIEQFEAIRSLICSTTGYYFRQGYVTIGKMSYEAYSSQSLPGSKCNRFCYCQKCLTSIVKDDSLYRVTDGKCECGICHLTGAMMVDLGSCRKKLSVTRGERITTLSNASIEPTCVTFPLWGNLYISNMVAHLHCIKYKLHQWI